MTARTLAAMAGVIVVAVVVGLIVAWPPDLDRRSAVLELEVGRLLAQSGVRSARLVEETRTLARIRGRSYHVIEKTYRCPPRFSPEQFAKDLEHRLGPLGFELLRSERRQTDQGTSTVLRLGPRRQMLYQLTLSAGVIPQPVSPAVTVPVIPELPQGHGKVAIVLDDWGYSRRLVPSVIELNRPLTLAVLPHRPFSTAVAEAVQGSRCEVILHMPMEPHSGSSPREPAMLSPGMSITAVRKMLDDALATVPHAVGVSNHQGSKATEDRALMRLVLHDLSRRRLVFLDSLVTEQSVCQGIARQIKIPFARRSVFLDNVETPEAIRGQLIEVAEVALKTGSAIGIGHDKQVTLEVLKEMMPLLEQRGIEFVRLSELTKVP